MVLRHRCTCPPGRTCGRFACADGPQHCQGPDDAGCYAGLRRAAGRACCRGAGRLGQAHPQLQLVRVAVSPWRETGGWRATWQPSRKSHSPSRPTGAAHEFAHSVAAQISRAAMAVSARAIRCWLNRRGVRVSISRERKLAHNSAGRLACLEPMAPFTLRRQPRRGHPSPLTKETCCFANTKPNRSLGCGHGQGRLGWGCGSNKTASETRVREITRW